MNRSTFLSACLALACSLAGCRAQSERADLRATVTQLEQQLQSVDRAVAAMERSAAQRAQQHTDQLADKARRIAQLEQELIARGAALEQARAETRTTARDLRAELTAERERTAAERTELQAALAQQRAAAEAARAEAARAAERAQQLEAQVAELTKQHRTLAQAQSTATAPPPTPSPAWLQAEREQIAALRASIERELAALPRRGREPRGDKRPAEDDAALERASAPGTIHVHGGVGTMVIHADQGTVHIYVDEQRAAVRGQARQLGIDATPPTRGTLVVPGDRKKSR
jgi:DNA repair exonuclease SbcCD ATPase subunit